MLLDSQMIPGKGKAVWSEALKAHYYWAPTHSSWDGELGYEATGGWRSRGWGQEEEEVSRGACRGGLQDSNQFLHWGAGGRLQGHYRASWEGEGRKRFPEVSHSPSCLLPFFFRGWLQGAAGRKDVSNPKKKEPLPFTPTTPTALQPHCGSGWWQINSCQGRRRVKFWKGCFL